jgi:hypothetical protein
MHVPTISLLNRTTNVNPSLGSIYLLQQNQHHPMDIEEVPTSNKPPSTKVITTQRVAYGGQQGGRSIQTRGCEV